MAKMKMPKKGDKLKFLGSDDDNIPYEQGDILIVQSTEKSSDGRILATVSREGGAKDEMHEQVYMGDEAEPFTGKSSKAAKAEKAPAKAKAKSKAKVADEDEEMDSEEPDGDEDMDGDEEESEMDEAPARSSRKAKSKAVKAAKPKAPARTEEEADEDFEHSASVKKLLKKGDMLDAAKALVSDADRSYFNLGGVLVEIQRTAAYEEAGFTEEKKEKVKGKTKMVSAFEQYISAELGIEYKKATRLMIVYKTFSKLGIPEDKVLGIGWTKAGVIASLMRDATADEVMEMLEAAEDMRRDDLIEHIKETSVDARGRARGDSVKKVKYTFSAFADQAEFIGQIIQSTMETLGTDDMNEAMVYIMTQYAASVDGVDVPMQDAIAAVEARYGIELAVKGEDESDEDSEPEMPKAKAKKAKAEKAPAKKAAKSNVTKMPKAEKAKAKAPVKAKAKGKKKAA